jgi:deazaflavin-dependent oxidoreductase (nitroreductase family)
MLYSPLLGIPDGSKIVLLASYYGRPRHPAWYYNLRAHPRVYLELPGSYGWYVAEEVGGASASATGDRRWRCTQALRPTSVWPARKIPVIVLTPSD